MQRINRHVGNYAYDKDKRWSGICIEKLKQCSVNKWSWLYKMKRNKVVILNKKYLIKERIELDFFFWKNTHVLYWRHKTDRKFERFSFVNILELKIILHPAQENMLIKKNWKYAFAIVSRYLILFISSKKKSRKYNVVIIILIYWYSNSNASMCVILFLITD